MILLCWLFCSHQKDAQCLVVPKNKNKHRSMNNLNFPYFKYILFLTGSIANITSLYNKKPHENFRSNKKSLSFYGYLYFTKWMYTSINGNWSTHKTWPTIVGKHTELFWYCCWGWAEYALLVISKSQYSIGTI